MEVLEQKVTEQEVAESEGGFTGELCVSDETGHSRIQWDKHNPAQVAAAKARFDELKARGYLAYRVNAQGGQAEVLHAFDPDAERIMMNQRLVGG